jgi:antitoxin component YwqK of YwqJK toxin-antitoxin module
MDILPSKTEYYDNGNIKLVEYYNIFNKLHRIEHPAFFEVIYNSICILSYSIYYIDGKIHRDNAPAYFKRTNTKIVEEKYYYYNKCHRIDGPAIIIYHSKNGKIKEEHYYSHGLLHRDKLPAIIIYDINGNIIRKEYYINGVKQNINKCILM